MSSKKLTPLSNTEAASFCSQMALILKSGISSIEGITIMLEDSKEPNEKKLLSQIHKSMLETGILYESLAETMVFPDYLLEMIRIGEQTGKLDEVMDSLAGYYEKEANLALTIKQAITYPLIMVILMIAVILVLIMKVMPVFHQVFQQFGSEMTGFSRLILNIGEFLNSHFIVFLCVCAVIVLLFVFLFKLSKGQQFSRSFMYKFTNTRELSEQLSAYRFSNGMALTLSSGLSPEECLQQTLKLTDSGPFRQKLDTCCQSVTEGEDLCKTLVKNGIFTDVYGRMAMIASRTGVLDEVMHTIARQYEEEIDAQFTKLIARVEPTLVIILSLIVGAILLSVMLPLMGIMTAM